MAGLHRLPGAGGARAPAAAIEPNPAIPIGLRRRQPAGLSANCLASKSLASGETKAVDVDGKSVLLVRLGDEWLALANRCGESPLPLQFSRLEGATLHCSWHGCQYDVRTGVRLDGPGDRLHVFPVSVENGNVRIAIDVETA